jgi:hypothetical protein
VLRLEDEHVRQAGDDKYLMHDATRTDNPEVAVVAGTDLGRPYELAKSRRIAVPERGDIDPKLGGLVVAGLREFCREWRRGTSKLRRTGSRARGRGLSPGRLSSARRNGEQLVYREVSGFTR